jgi:hypothetical protein
MNDKFFQPPSTAAEIVLLAEQLDCGPPEVALRFAQLVATHCAEISEELPPDASARQAGKGIRDAFGLANR